MSQFVYINIASGGGGGGGGHDWFQLQQFFDQAYTFI